VRENLAEASLTSGKYDEAIGIARELRDGAEVKATTGLNMRFIGYAALALANRQADADAARRDLIAYYNSLSAGFKNDWTYGGTRRYIERAAVAAPVKKAVLTALDQIERPK
jgi:hypothetical protein